MSEISPALYRAGSGEPLLLLHGFTGTWHHWRPLLGELVARYEVIAPTLPGHYGGPAYPFSSSIKLSGATGLLERQLDDLGVDTAHVVGNSLGGALALELSKRGRARSVVAIAPSGGAMDGDGEWPRVGRFFARQVRSTRATAPGLPIIMRRPGFRHLALRDIMRHGELVAPADAVDLARASLGCSVIGRVLGALRADRDLSLHDLGTVAAPVLLAERHAPRLRREIPRVEWRLLPDCVHVPMWDDTRLLVRIISEFVDRHTAPAAMTMSALAQN